MKSFSTHGSLFKNCKTMIVLYSYPSLPFESNLLPHTPPKVTERKPLHPNLVIRHVPTPKSEPNLRMGKLLYFSASDIVYLEISGILPID